MVSPTRHVCGDRLLHSISRLHISGVMHRRDLHLRSRGMSGAHISPHFVAHPGDQALFTEVKQPVPSRCENLR